MDQEKTEKAEKLLRTEMLTKWQEGRDTGYGLDPARVEEAWRLLRDALGLKQLGLEDA